MEVGARITQLRMAFAMSQYALGKRSGIAQGALSQYESGQKTPGIDSLEKICNGLGITLRDFFDSEANVPGRPVVLSTEEQELLCNYRCLSISQQKDCRCILRLLADQKTK